MEDFYKIPENELRYTARFLRKEMITRGWGEASVVRTPKKILIFAARPDGKKLRFCSCMAGTTSVFAASLADDKMASYEVMKQEGIPQPETIYLPKDKDEMRVQLVGILEKYQKIVIKPVDGAHGRDIVTDISDIDEAMKAADCGGGMVAQEQLLDDIIEVRAICVGGKFIDAFKRIPAMVTGDGEHSILELIDKENRETRVEAYLGDSARIDKEAAIAYLDKCNIDKNRVPASGEKVRVISICNVGVGGTVEETELDPKLIELAEKAARTIDLPLIGVDFYGDKVIEVNPAPSLYYPTGDDSADKCVKAYVDYLENLKID